MDLEDTQPLPGLEDTIVMDAVPMSSRDLKYRRNEAIMMFWDAAVWGPGPVALHSDGNIWTEADYHAKKQRDGFSDDYR